MQNKQQIRSQIIQYYKLVGSRENIIQAIKQALFLNQKFNPLLIFELISQGKNKIIKNDWKLYLQSKNIGFTDEQLKYFFNLNHFYSEINLNQFLQAILPYNADVIREFKNKYLESLQIQEMGPEIQFIFAQLMNSWMQFIKMLLTIRREISKKVNIKQIQHLVKQDLVLYSKPRQARKYHQYFKENKFQLSFHELRKFLQLWVSPKQLLHQFCLLNVKRHIKCNNPFQKIIYHIKKVKQRQPSTSRSKQKKKQLLSQDKKQQKKFNKHVGIKQSQIYHDKIKYEQYKKQLQNQLQKSVHIGQSHKIKNKQHCQSNSNQKQQHAQINKFNSQLENQFKNSAVKKYIKNISENKNQYVNKQPKKNQSEQHSYKKYLPGNIIVKILQEIVIKQQKLQKLRKQLAKSTDFNLINLFKLIDHQNKGYICAGDINQFCQSSEPVFDNVVKFFGRDANKLRLQEFSLVFRPLSKQLNENLDKRPEHKVPNPFKRQTSTLIRQILKLSADMHNNIQNSKQKIREQGISSKSLFEYIDLDNYGFITSENMRELLQENNVKCQAKQLKCLMKLFNKRVDEKIYWKEFSNFIDL